MVKTIKFDEQNYLWSDNYEYNKAVIENKIEYIKTCFKIRGYVYLNTIYESFGVGWDPNWSNDCSLYGINDLVISYEHLNDADFEINISY